MIQFFPVTHKDEINVLRGMRSQIGDFVYGHDDESSGEDETLARIRTNLHRKDSFYQIATEEGVFAGFCSLDTEWWEEGYMFLREIFVHPDFQGRGIGAVFMERCIGHARAAGFQGIVTETAFENTAMQGLCKKYGFGEWENPQWQDGITFRMTW